MSVRFCGAKTLTRAFSLLLSIAFLCCLYAADSTFTAQTYKVKVTYYDYHCDGSSAAFQPNFSLIGGSFGAVPGLVQDTLDAERKPLYRVDTTKTRKPSCAEYVGQWYRPWVRDTLMWIIPPDTVPVCRIDSTQPSIYTTFWGTVETTYTVQLCDTVPIAADTITSDTALKNIVIEDSLEFFAYPYYGTVYKGIDPVSFMTLWDTIKCPNAYMLNSVSDKFFPLDSRGFHNLADTVKDTILYRHNFAFAMEMHNSFTYHGGEVLSVRSDDDSWVFINNRLCVDEGGLHLPPDRHNLLIDSLGLTAGQTYNFDLFFAERYTGGSTLMMSTDIVFLDKANGSREITITPVVPQAPSATRHGAAGIPVRILPNLTVRVPGNTSAFVCDIFDVGGKRLYSSSTAGSAAFLKRPPAGIYLLKVTCRDNLGTIAGVVSRTFGVAR
jgi:fibro-slime domain-containing protein